MKIIACSPFFKENLLARIKAQELSGWVDEIHITEANRTHRNEPKEYFFDRALLTQFPKLRYHALDVARVFRSDRRLPPHFVLNPPRATRRIFRKTIAYNDSVLRNLACKVSAFGDEDVIILSDMDEIADARMADRLVDAVNQHGIVTAWMHYSFYFFNLFSVKWAGPVNYGYRLFLIKGKRLREEWKLDADWLRKQGERGHLVGAVHCLEQFCGYHHSFLGDEEFIRQKMTDFSRSEKTLQCLNSSDIKRYLSEKRSIFPGHELRVDNSIPQLRTVEQLRSELNDYFV